MNLSLHLDPVVLLSSVTFVFISRSQKSRRRVHARYALDRPDMSYRLDNYVLVSCKKLCASAALPLSSTVFKCI